MTAPDHAPEPKKTLAPAGPSTHDGWYQARTRGAEDTGSYRS
jgi:hypothetical protein